MSSALVVKTVRDRIVGMFGSFAFELPILELIVAFSIAVS